MTGNLAVATWVNVAPDLGLTLLVPELAVYEVRTLLPASGEQLAVLFENPNVLRVDLTAASAEQVVQRLAVVDAFDAAGGHVVHIAEARDWPVLSTDPGRLRRLAPDLDVGLV